MSAVECPYCGEDQEINHDDGYGYDEGEVHQQECGSCEKTFAFTTCISYDYEVSEAPCMNGDPHKWKATCTIPKFYTKMRCEYCDEHREMTPEEKLEHNIPENPYGDIPF